MGKQASLVGLHVRVPPELYARLLVRRDRLWRKTKAMVSLSEAVREVLERGLKELG